MNNKHDKGKVISKGMSLFWVNGYHNLGVDKICKETGMTKGAFYNSFKGKENFLLVVIEAYGNLISSHLQKQLSDLSRPPIDRLHNLYNDMLLVQPESEYRGCLVNNMMSELGALNPVVAEVASAQFEKFVNIIEPTVLQAQQDGELDNSLNSKLMTEIIHTTFFGILTRTKSTKTLHLNIITDLLNLLKNKNNGRKKN
ncbi:TetR/AcrR family transcriptional repressor of nem operon [Algoriphagus sp. 4150]|uniref:TetR/AcrR family transcriptional regulator n=1 Tax=Algoriphagus sp. 4150 TaxID=2817756 RepID=UPI00285569C0|nr:TetR/AcrR family transcriptional regulator [Algoriphagus sp. 4150]MDR7130055.1 TetR/AcrR family transcriptional repressor of nem operon [Algoriphagus sp. 4150]